MADAYGVEEQRWWSAVWLIPRRCTTNTFERTDLKANCFARSWRMLFERQKILCEAFLEKGAYETVGES